MEQLDFVTSCSVVPKDVHRRLGNIGKITEDYSDIVEHLLDFLEEHHHQNGKKES
ncbi:MAG: hypothetical protein M3299_14740 [Thermoproteota archaeon]|nr:hypothetical protein [Thermoproteota archaeon]